MQQTWRALCSSPLSRPAVFGVFFLWGALISGASVQGVLLPLGVAALAATPSGMLLPTAAGVMAALLLYGGLQGIRYSAACAVLVAVRLLFKESRSLRSLFWFEPLLAGTVTLSTGLAMLLSGDGDLMFGLESVAAALCAALFKQAAEALLVLRAGGQPAEGRRWALTATLCLTGYAGTSLLFGATLQGAVLAALALLALARTGRAEPAQKSEPPPLPSPAVQFKLERTAEVLRELTDRLKSGQSFLPITAVFAPTIETLCRGCARSPLCWDADYNTMADALNNMGVTLSRRRQLQEGDLPEAFTQRCDKPGSFVDSVNAEAAMYDLTRRFRDESLGESAFLREQYKCFSLVLGDLGEDLATPEQSDAAVVELVDTYLKEKGDKPVSVSAGYGKHGKLRISCKTREKPELSGIASLVQQSCNCRLAEPELWRSESGWHMILSEAENFAVSLDRYISPLPGERMAGDAVRDFRTDDMKYILALSDGMGAGRAASCKSRLAVDYLEKLMQAGLRRESATQVLNAALMVGPEPEVFATLDVVVLDLYSGDLEFVKAGAAPSFILRGRELTRVDSHSMPAGVLPVLEPEIHRSSAQPGDSIILLSDGLLPPGQSEQPLCEFILSFDRKRGSLARAMVNFCKKLYQNQPGDDMTAVVLDIRKA
ncbi:MAG: SpoIIE family protein phosphatase [Clostridiales bacterium]|nr:SpoIIE family protein phosphatase [Clostridiales bacterium]